MMIFFKERLAFLAVPKTGTSSLERALSSRASALFRDPPGIKHTNARGFEAKYRKLFERKDLKPLETVAVMREPIDWLGSWYRYRARTSLIGHANSTDGLSFDTFVEGFLAEKQPPYAQVGSQGRFVTDQNGDLLINHLFGYHDFSAATRFLESRLSTKIDLKTLNKSPVKPLTLSKHLIAELKTAHQLDFQIYDALLDGPLSIP